MPHFPKPFFKKSRGVWYVEINRHQIKLGPDRDDAFQRYHQFMATPREQPVASDSLAAIIDAFLEWTQRNGSETEADQPNREASGSALFALRTSPLVGDKRPSERRRCAHSGHSDGT